MASVTIDGQTFTISGNDISITSRGGSIVVNGQTLTAGLSGTVNLKIEGAVARIEADGSVTCGDVTGKVNAGGSVTCSNVTGNVAAGGSARVSGNVSGGLTAGGSIRTGA
jgi:hypothetical protein